ncbi:crotonase/enoyl-CoA hydratase family protein [Spongiactinospora sp. TRM90649]|uniref:crotonase/enoyl-CoA hydratase family protein n=1 Tax=Spongiactinospora sp. TRM90649 TaxID=3031114 RepID=UPI0023F9A79C|nr:crotonase/enoyl-CoA hydratase family protein [Spongiactinospora sp. TRM90649]MDF5753582.1 crotonase/enoyl-CoA hydratase family protein [Spongiactinospora sp. TRM90649]
MNESKAVHYERRDGLALIRLDRPEAANAIDPPALRALGAAYHRADNDDQVKVVVLHAEGRDFSAGLDPTSFLPVLRAREYSADGPGLINPFGTTTRLSKPLVVAVQGTVGAMAHELMLAADIRIAASDARFGQGEVSRGTSPAGGGGARMPLTAGWGNAMRWILTGESWDAAEAFRLGLVQEVVAPGEQVPRAVELAERIATHPPLAVRETLRLGRRAWEGHAQQVLAELVPTLYRLLNTRDFAERLTAMREGREPVYVGE